MAQAPAIDEVFAERLRFLRGQRGWTQTDLADRLTELGASIQQPTLAKIENGQRNVKLADLFAIAAALECSPSSLLLPADEQPVAVTPTWHVGASRVRKWLAGLAVLGTPKQPSTPAGTSFFFAAQSDEEKSAMRYPVAVRVRGLAQGLWDAAAAGDESRMRFLTVALDEEARRAHASLEAGTESYDAMRQQIDQQTEQALQDALGED